MRKLIALLTVLVLGVTGVALAAKTKKVQIGGTIHSAVVTASAKGGQIAGAAKDRHFGQIAVVFNDAKPAKRVRTPFTFYTRDGSYSGVATSDITADASGNVKISKGTFKVTRGGGSLKGVKGSGTFSGTGKLDTNQTITYRGTLTVRR